MRPKYIWVYTFAGDYCKFGNFRENFIFANSDKRHIWDVKNSRLGHDFREELFSRNFSYAKFSENKTLKKIS